MKVLLTAVAAAACLVAAPAMAQVNGSIGYTQFRDSGLNLSGLTGRVGYDFMKYVGVEGEATVGIDNQTIHEDGVAVDVKLEHQYAAYLVGKLPVNDKLDVFARVGYGNTRVKGSDASGATDVAISAADNAAIYGVGATWYFAGHSGVRADYTHSESIKNAWSVSYAFRF